MDIEDLTKEERNAIATLERLAKRWPPSLMLFSWSGTLCVMRATGSGGYADLGNHSAQDAVITTIDIPNDGGDP